MTDTLETLQRQLGGASDLKSVVRSMKALAASSIGQYEKAVVALVDYDRAVRLGLTACLKKRAVATTNRPGRTGVTPTTVLVFGSDQGLVGQFNDSLAEFVANEMASTAGPKTVWAVGEHVQSRLLDVGMPATTLFLVPTAVSAISTVVGKIFVESDKARAAVPGAHFYVFYNRREKHVAYEPSRLQLLPLDDAWAARLAQAPWPTNMVPEALGDPEATLEALIREHLFVSLFKACAESLAAENASRLLAMQRAERNIDELMATLQQTFRRLRQTAIDEELFDVVAGYEMIGSVER